MYKEKRRSDRVEIKIPIRIRGMSSENKFFDEVTETRLLSKHGLMTRLRFLVDLETEVHVTNLQNTISGTFRVVWVNTRAQEGLHNLGLELVETDGEMWGIHFPPSEPVADPSATSVKLECRRCRTRVHTAVPETEIEYLTVGFLIARHCDRCKATTPWEFAVEAEGTDHAGAKGSTRKKVENELRANGRVTIKMKIKVIRRVYGTPREEICETKNVSRSGVCFHTSEIYDVGEKVEVVMPYKEGDISIAVPARVVRLDQFQSVSQRAVAVQLERARS